MTTATLTALLPRTDTPTAIQTSMTAIAEERRGAEARLLELQARRDAALLDAGSNTKAIVSVENETRDTKILIERLDAIAPQLEAKLTTARETAQRAEADRLARVAEEAIARFAEMLGDYQQHARAIAAICEANHRATEALGIARRAAHALGLYKVFDDCRDIANGVVLPSLSSDKMIWGKAPQPVSPYEMAR